MISCVGFFVSSLPAVLLIKTDVSVRATVLFATFGQPPMAGVDSSEVLVTEVEDGLQSLVTSRRKDLTKTAKDVIETVLPEITKVITVAVSAAVKAILNQMSEAIRSKSVDSFLVQRQALLMKYECDKLEQYQRSDNVSIYGISEDSEETKEGLEKKVIELVSNLGADLQPREISVAHRLGKPRDRD